MNKDRIFSKETFNKIVNKASPIQKPNKIYDEEILEECLSILAVLIEDDGDVYLPIFLRLEDEKNKLIAKKNLLDKYLNKE